MFLRPSQAYRPHLTGLQRIARYAVLALELGSRNEPLNAIRSHDVAEVRASKLRRADPFLLLLDSASGFHRNPHSPFDVLIGDLGLDIGIEELKETAYRLVGGVGIPPAERSSKEYSALHLRE